MTTSFKNSTYLKKILYFIGILAAAMILSQLVSLLISTLLNVNIEDIYTIQDNKNIYALKTIQLLSSIIIFILAPLVFFISTNYNYKTLFYVKQKQPITVITLLIIFFFASSPIISTSEIMWQKLLSLDVFKHLLIIAKNQDLVNQAILKSLLVQKGVLDIALNIIIIALIPAIGEELFFRGIIQNFFSYKFSPHLAIILTSIIFSVIHIDIIGILPRLLISLYLGYLFYWSSSLIYPIIAHFINNGAIVVAYYAFNVPLSNMENSQVTTFWYFIVISVIVTIIIFRTIKKKLNESTIQA
ncbi:MAG: CPBP family intramembrane glutamic endopeptidase [Solitalea-like symbiont of Acarus siro]